MQTDQSIDSATATSRRTFLTRTAVGGALVTAGALALPVGSLVLDAGARPADQGDLGDEDFAAFATGLELAAVAAYTAAFDRDILDDEWARRALTFQSHHQDVADTLVTLGDESATPVADASFAKRSIDAIDAASDQQGILAALAVVEETLAATHLAGIGRLAEKTTARTVTQVLAVEGQQAALLGVASGSTIAKVTPATNSGDAALTIPATGTGATTTTTPAGASSDSKTNDSTPETADDTQTSAPSAND